MVSSNISAPSAQLSVDWSLTRRWATVDFKQFKSFNWNQAVTLLSRFIFEKWSLSAAGLLVEALCAGVDSFVDHAVGHRQDQEGDEGHHKKVGKENVVSENRESNYFKGTLLISAAD